MPVMKGGKITPIDNLGVKVMARMNIGIQRRGPDPSYNCHGLTFAAKLGYIGTPRPHIPRLALTEPIEAEDTDKDIMQLLIYNGYQRLAERANIRVDKALIPREEVDVGDVLLYVRAREGPGRIDHSGIVVEVSKAYEVTPYVLVLSKFGDGGEYIHHYCNIPDDYPTGLEVWTDREV